MGRPGAPEKIRTPRPQDLVRPPTLLRNLTGRCLPSPLPQRRQSQLRRQPVELHHQFARHRHAVLYPVGAATAAFLAGEPDGIDAGQLGGAA
jgi:hypothetical protein